MAQVASSAASAARKPQRSLFGEILDWMLAPLLLLWPMSLALTGIVAQQIANRPYDRELGQAARSLARQVVTEPAPRLGVSPRTLERLLHRHKTLRPPMRPNPLLHLQPLRPRSLGVRCWVAWPLAWAWLGWPALWAWAKPLATS